MTLKLCELPKYERPYEKLELYGSEKLSTSELLAIIIESGTREETSINLAQKVLHIGNEYNDTGLRFLQNVSLEELKQIKGIGRVKAIRLKATFEIAKRIAVPLENEIILNSTKDVANFFMEELRYEKRELVKVVILNSKNKIIKIENVSLGGTNYAMLEPKDVLAGAVKLNAEKIILIHNHPSGDASPSIADFDVTKRIELCAEMLGIKLIDHVIIGDGTFCSVLKTNKTNI